VHNRAEVFRLVRERGEISRADLAKITHLTRKTISEIAAELIEKGLFIELGKGASSGGKRPILLALRRLAQQAIGLDLSSDKVLRGVRLDLGGNLVVEKTWATRPQTILEDSRRAVEELSQGIPKKGLMGIGVAVSGLVDRRSMEVRFSAHFPLAGGVLQKTLGSMSPMLVVENSTHAASALEYSQGALRGVRHGVFVHTARGVGAGLILEGRLFRGGMDGAGEIGQVRFPQDPEGPTLEDRVSEEALWKNAGLKIESVGEAEAILKTPPPALQEALRLNAQTMAWGLSTLANVVSPEMLVLGGQIVKYGPLWFDAFVIEFRRHLVAPFREKMAVRLSGFESAAVARGAAELILERVTRGENPEEP
jgi:predicted NBD/HSP70 family sugar kinase